MKKKTKQSINVFVPITMLSSSWKGDFDKLPANKTYELIIDYPMEKPAIYPIKTGKNGMSLAVLLNKIGELYEKTYEIEDSSEEGEYGIYGHDIGDLNLSGVNINHKTKKITLDVDS